MRSVSIVFVALLMLTSLSVAAAKQPVNPHADGVAPRNAKVLFDGKDLSAWTRDNGKPCAWNVDNGLMVITSTGGGALSKYEFEAGHIHLEFNLPKNGKGHGNSGIYIHQIYEVQIIDSFNNNPYAPGQQCGALYKEFPPDKQVCKAPGEWQTYDVIFHSPTLDAAGKVVKPARFTIWLNGVLVHNNRELSTGTGAGKKRKMVSKGPILLQNHGAAVKFRNIWVQPLSK